MSESRARPSRKNVPNKKLSGLRFVLRRGDSRYPQALEEVKEPPNIIYGIGDPDALVEGLAVIGARRATPYGIGCARKFAGIAASKGVVIISGGAYGCDQAAHNAALENGGRTVVVLGGGCDRVYPAKHFNMFQQVIDNGGAVISEYSWDAEPRPFMFRKRNRIIAGLAKATLIVEAGKKSGTFSTADNALSQGKDVLVVPGPINSKNSLGSNSLLRQGATPIIDEDSFGDSLLYLFGVLKDPPEQLDASSFEDDFEDPVIRVIAAALSGAPMRTSELLEELELRKLKVGEPELLLLLSELEIDDVVCRYADGRYGMRL